MSLAWCRDGTAGAGQLTRPGGRANRGSATFTPSPPEVSRALIETLLPGQDGVVHLDRPGPDHDRSLHALGRNAGVHIPGPAVERLCSFVAGADMEAYAVEASITRRALGRGRDGARHAASAVLRPHRHVLQLGRVRQLHVCMPER